jgi:hypothetical protein
VFDSALGREPVRKHKGSQRPVGFNIWPEYWQSLSPKKRQQLREELMKTKDKDGAASACAILSTYSDPGTPCAAAAKAEPGGKLKVNDFVVSYPAMPCAASKPQLHRDKITNDRLVFSAMVARAVSRKEVRMNPKAQAAVQKEWDRLRLRKVWEEKQVREWSDVAAEARRNGTKAHVGRIFDICVKGKRIA